MVENNINKKKSLQRGKMNMINRIIKKNKDILILTPKKEI